MKTLLKIELKDSGYAECIVNINEDTDQNQLFNELLVLMATNKEFAKIINLTSDFFRRNREEIIKKINSQSNEIQSRR